MKIASAKIVNGKVRPIFQVPLYPKKSQVLFIVFIHLLISYSTELREITKAECQEMCVDACIAIYRPVCAEYNGVRRTFSNSCALGAHICRSGESKCCHVIFYLIIYFNFFYFFYSIQSDCVRSV